MSSTVVIFDGFKVFNFYLFLISSPPPLFLEKYSSNFDFVTHKSWVYNRLNAFKFLKWSTRITDLLSSRSTMQSKLTFFPSF